MTARHFLKRDFLDLQLYWVAMGIVAPIMGAAAYRASGDVLFWLLFVLISFLFLSGEFATISVMGRPRDSHSALSTHYLLALPIGHKRLFAIQHLRILVFWVPLLIFGSLCPFIRGGFHPSSSETWLLYYLGLLTTVGIMIELLFSSQLEFERITSYLPKEARLKAHLMNLSIFLVLLFFLQGAWVRLMAPTVDSSLFKCADPRIVFPVGAILLCFWIPRNARRWCVTLQPSRGGSLN